MRKRIQAWKGDITKLEVDAIVNAANTRLLPGSGVCGAIHSAAGPELMTACLALGGCPTGEARMTPGFGLTARYVIHAVGPVWQGGKSREETLLASCYQQSLALATEHGLETIAFPAISTGIYGFPPERAARIAVRTVLAYLAEYPLPHSVTLVAYGDDSYPLLDRALRQGLARFQEHRS